MPVFVLNFIVNFGYMLAFKNVANIYPVLPIKSEKRRLRQPTKPYILFVEMSSRFCCCCVLLGNRTSG